MSERVQLRNGYFVHRAFATGGMGSVHLGKMRSPDGRRKIVAIKRMSPELARDPASLAQFMDEASLTVRIRHPNVVTVEEAIVHDGELFIVSEFYDSVPLSKVLQRCFEAKARVPNAVAFAITNDILSGLEGAHETKGRSGELLEVVHRDISLQNILLGRFGVSKIVDFGIAKSKGRLAETQVGFIRGKLGYMAPEQMSGSRSTDKRADLFAAGVVLWELIAGDRLYEGDSFEEFDKMLRSGNIPVPSNSTSPDTMNFLKRALSSDRNARYSNAQEMRAALAKLGEFASPEEVAAWVKPLLQADFDELDLALSEFEATEATIVLPSKGETAHSGFFTSDRIRVSVMTAATIFFLSSVGFSLYRIMGPSSVGDSLQADGAVATTNPVGSTSGGATLSAGGDETPVGTATEIRTDAAAPDPTSKEPRKKPWLTRPPRLNCNPPYTLDANGRKRYKPHCL